MAGAVSAPTTSTPTINNSAASSARPVYNGTATSRIAQNAWDAAHAATNNTAAKPAASSMPLYNGTSTSRLAQQQWLAANDPLSTRSNPNNYGGMSNSSKNWYNSYSGALANGTANTAQFQQYQNMSKQYGLQTHSANNTALQKLSLAALGGDTNAQNYLNATKTQAMSGPGLWNGVQNPQLDANSKLQQAYMQANPYTDYTKGYDMNIYNTVNQALQNGGPISQDQMTAYQNAVGKWNLQDQSSPYYKEQSQAKSSLDSYLSALQGNEQSQLGQYQQSLKDSLAAQDVGLNSNLVSIDQNAFQQQQQLQQQMQDRGLGNSGIADDTYMRALMGNNASYQKAYADTANQKATLNSDYAKNVATVQNDYADKANAANNQYQSYLDTINQNQATNALDQQKNQQAQDQFLTQQTGILYQNGQPVTSGGQAISTLDAQKAQQAQDQFLTQQTGVLYQNGQPVTGSNGQPMSTLTAQNQSYTQQSTQDKYLTTSTGYVWLNGQMLTDKSGKPITSLAWQQLSETERHNLATEQNSANQTAINAQNVANNYQVGMTNANTNATKVANDYAVAQGNLSIARDKANISAQQATASIQNAQTQLAISAQNATTSASKAQLSSLQSQLGTINSQINAYQKANPGKPIPSNLANAMASIGDQMSSIRNSLNFQQPASQGVVTQAPATTGPAAAQPHTIAP